MNRRASSFHFSEKRMFLIILLLATSTVPIPLILNQNHTAIAQQQQKDKGLVVVGGVHSPEFQEKNLLHLTKKVYSVGDK